MAYDRKGVTIAVVGTTAFAIILVTVGVIEHSGKEHKERDEKEHTTAHRETPIVVTPPVAPPSIIGDVIGIFGSKGTGPGQLDSPKVLAVGPDKTIWTVDLPNRVQAFDPAGKVVHTFAPTTKNVGQGPLEDDIGNVEGIAIDHNRNVWITIGYDLLELSDTGALKKKIPMKRPDICFSDVSIDKNDMLFVTSYCAKEDTHAILVVDAVLGTITHRFPEGNSFTTATDYKIGIDPLQGYIFCPHSQDRKVVVRDKNGNVTNGFTAIIPSDSPRSIAVDAKGRIFLRTFNGIDVFDDQLRPLGSLHVNALDVAIGPDDDLYVLTNDGVTHMHVHT